jgi:hypothetical protein
MKYKFFAEKSIFQSGIKLHMADVSGKRIAVATNITFYEVDDNSVREAPLLNLSAEDAQHLMDELYHVGMRPSQAAGSAGQLDAVKYHLEDMRTLALKRGGA